MKFQCLMMKNKGTKKIIAVIPARGGSKGIPRKNIKILAGKPLIAWTIETAKKSKYLDRVIVSTENREIAEISKKYGAEVVKRPEELATDAAPIEPVLEQVITYLENNENYNPDIIVLLQPTSPIRFARHIDEAVKTFLQGEYDSLMSVRRSYALIWRTEKNRAIPVNFDFTKRERRQDAKPEYEEDGAIYVFKKQNFMKEKTIPCGQIGLYIMPKENSLEIDEEFDFWLCEAIIKHNKLC